MPTTEYSPIIEAAGTLDSLGEDIRLTVERVADLRALVGRFETALVGGFETAPKADELVGDLDDLGDELAMLVHDVERGFYTAMHEVDAAAEDRREHNGGLARLTEAVLDVERNLGTWADVLALARKLA
jgi:hypothetical protein